MLGVDLMLEMNPKDFSVFKMADQLKLYFGKESEPNKEISYEWCVQVGSQKVELNVLDLF